MIADHADVITISDDVARPVHSRGGRGAEIRAEIHRGHNTTRTDASRRGFDAEGIEEDDLEHFKHGGSFLSWPPPVARREPLFNNGRVHLIYLLSNGAHDFAHDDPMIRSRNRKIKLPRNNK